MDGVQDHLRILGMKVVDKVTGFAGVATSVSFDLYGCVQVVVTPPAVKGAAQVEGRWFDIPRLTVTGNKPVMPLPDYSAGYVAEGRKGAAEKPAMYR